MAPMMPTLWRIGLQCIPGSLLCRVISTLPNLHFTLSSRGRAARKSRRADATQQELRHKPKKTNDQIYRSPTNIATHTSQLIYPTEPPRLAKITKPYYPPSTNRTIIQIITGWCRRCVHPTTTSDWKHFQHLTQPNK